MANYKSADKLKVQKQFSLSRETVQLIHDMSQAEGQPQSWIVEKAVELMHELREKKESDLCEIL